MQLKNIILEIVEKKVDKQNELGEIVKSPNIQSYYAAFLKNKLEQYNNLLNVLIPKRKQQFELSLCLDYTESDEKMVFMESNLEKIWRFHKEANDDIYTWYLTDIGIDNLLIPYSSHSSPLFSPNDSLIIEWSYSAVRVVYKAIEEKTNELLKSLDTDVDLLEELHNIKNSNELMAEIESNKEIVDKMMNTLKEFSMNHKELKLSFCEIPIWIRYDKKKLRYVIEKTEEKQEVYFTFHRSGDQIRQLLISFALDEPFDGRKRMEIDLLKFQALWEPEACQEIINAINTLSEQEEAREEEHKACQEIVNSIKTCSEQEKDDPSN